MFISPKTAIENGWIKGITNEQLQIQPNAIDFTLDRLFFGNGDDFIISKDPMNPSKELKQMRMMSESLPIEDRRTGVNLFHIEPSSVYDGMSNMYVEIPEGVVAQLVIRSSFNRNGIFLTSGLYDSGYKGHIGFALHNRSWGRAKIEIGTRIGQITFADSTNVGTYKGGWNHQQGTHFSENNNEKK